MMVDSVNPLVSVVIPAYNHEQFVSKCLDSLIADGYPNLEILLMDDGSHDKTYQLAQTWLAEHGQYFRSVHIAKQENSGIVKTLNKLVTLSSGEFVVLLASDDYLLPGGIEARISSLKDHPEWLAVAGDCIVIDENGKKRFDSGISELRGGNTKRLLDPKMIRRELLLKWSMPGPVLLLRRGAFDFEAGVGLYDEAFCVEDRDYYLRLLAKDALGFVNKKVAAYRIHSSNISSQHAQAESRVALLNDLSSISLKNMALFTGMDRLILRLQHFAYGSLASYIQNRNFGGRVISSMLWRLLNLIHFVFTKTARRSR